MDSDSNLKSFWALIKPHALPRLPWLVAVILLSSVGSAGLAFALLLAKPILGVLFQGSTFNTIGLSTAGESSWLDNNLASLAQWMADATGAVDGSALPMMLAIAAVLCVMGLVSGAATYGSIVIARWIGLRLVIDLRLRLARHLMGLSVRYHGTRRFGDLLSRISADVQQTLMTVDLALKELVRNPIEALFYIVVAVIVAPQLTLAVLVAMPALALPVVLLSKRVRKGSTRSLTSLGASVQALSQMFQGVRTVKAFRAEERELASYREHNEGYLRNAMKMVRAVALTQGWTVLISLVGFALMLVGIGLLAEYTSAFEGDPGVLMVFLVAISQAYNMIKRTTNAVTRVQESMGAAARLQGILNEPVDVVESANPQPISGLGAGVRFEGMTFSYAETDRPALRHIELDIRPGEKLAIVGASGSGKSTLMDLLARFIDPTEGRITVDGVDLRDASLDDWIAQYAMVGQTPFLFHTTIGENIGYGNPNASQEEIERAARAAHIHDFILSLPQGYETDVADAGARLSGGQRQRIAIARAVLKGAPLLLLDEATSALDSESEVAVQQALDELMEGRTVVVIAHRLSTIRNADRIAVLEDGDLIELGSHSELLARDGVYARLHALQTTP
ncbi:ABC transporter ATP-binding protein [Engelhardtia mirabilis]|uniref:Multidrug export ATP-binding/permease protein n=1 Tax=Engelhardtia mirabilis TaxID=2528011 RepID=A0A518BH54_9BACT|nr:Putative multidrug export ATP-binding/permease protein [Planctomycetes bacterium Pla133]QDV00622.1 Putative multidrug export ATP-binding/permease protein [Planctomycetes bacterium Pla86]